MMPLIHYVSRCHAGVMTRGQWHPHTRSHHPSPHPPFPSSTTTLAPSPPLIHLIPPSLPHTPIPHCPQSKMANENTKESLDFLPFSWKIFTFFLSLGKSSLSSFHLKNLYFLPIENLHFFPSIWKIFIYFLSLFPFVCFSFEWKIFSREIFFTFFPFTLFKNF